MTTLTDSEWEVLQRLPFVAFSMVAWADGAVQRKEAAAFVQELQRDAFCAEPLRRALANRILALDFMELIEETRDPRGHATELARCRDVLQRHLDPAAYKKFASSVVLFALRVALSARGAEGGEAKAASERSALNVLANGLELDVTDLEGALDDPCGG